MRNVFITDDIKSIGAVHSFFGGVLVVGANSLSHSSKLVDVGRVPRIIYAGFMAQCAMF